jgi:hypothetical protein
LRVFEVIDGERAFVEWWADFDCEEGRREELRATLSGWFGGWLESLRTSLRTPSSPEIAATEH